MTSPQHTLVSELSEQLNLIHAGVVKLRAAKDHANASKSVQPQAELYANKVKPIMESIRESADLLEGLCEDGRWPFPKLREILFTR